MFYCYFEHFTRKNVACTLFYPDKSCVIYISRRLTHHVSPFLTYASSRRQSNKPIGIVLLLRNIMLTLHKCYFVSPFFYENEAVNININHIIKYLMVSF